MEVVTNNPINHPSIRFEEYCLSGIGANATWEEQKHDPHFEYWGKVASAEVEAERFDSTDRLVAVKVREQWIATAAGWEGAFPPCREIP